MYKKITEFNEIKKYLIECDGTIVEALKKIDSILGRDLLVVANNKLFGVISDGDVRRSIMADGNLKKKVSEIANTKPIAFTQETFRYGVLNEMWVQTIPIIDDENNIIYLWIKVDKQEKISEAKKKTLLNAPVVIMAGGKGTRLYPFTKILPKPLIPIGDVPIMERIINRYVEYGLDKFYLTVNYKKNMIKSYFDELESDFEVVYIEEEKPLGTAGSLRLILDVFQQPIFVTNCDTLIEADYADIYKHHIESESAITIVSALKQIRIPYGVVNAGVDSTILSMEEKPNLSYFVNTGMYVVNPECLDEIPPNEMFHMPQLAEKLMDKGEKVSMYPISEDAFLDMGEFEEMKRMEQKLKV